MNGIVKFYNETKGYGFISGDDGRDYFFHITSVIGNCNFISKDQKVSYILSKGKKGYMAKNIIIKEESSSVDSNAQTELESIIYELKTTNEFQSHYKINFFIHIVVSILLVVAAFISISNKPLFSLLTFTFILSLFSLAYLYKTHLIIKKKPA